MIHFEPHLSPSHLAIFASVSVHARMLVYVCDSLNVCVLTFVCLTCDVLCHSCARRIVLCMHCMIMTCAHMCAQVQSGDVCAHVIVLHDRDVRALHDHDTCACVYTRCMIMMCVRVRVHAVQS